MSAKIIQFPKPEAGEWLAVWLDSSNCVHTVPVFASSRQAIKSMLPEGCHLLEATKREVKL